MFPYKLQSRQELTPTHIKKRLAMCKPMKSRFLDGLHRRIVFSDEKIFAIEQAHNHQNDRVYAVEPLTIDERIVTHQQHSKQVMVWAGVYYEGKLLLVFIDPTYSYDQVYYCQDILRGILRPWAQEYFGGIDWTYQQDGATSHMVNLTQEWLEKNVPDFIDKNQWPPRSPDLKLFGLFGLVDFGDGRIQTVARNRRIFEISIETGSG